MKSVLVGFAVLILVSAETAHAQASRFGATPAEYRAASVKLAVLEKDFVGLSKRYGVPTQTLRAIARGQVKSAPSLSSDKLRETMSTLAKETAGLRQQLAMLNGEVIRLRSRPDGTNDATTGGLSAQLQHASALLDAGNLSKAGEILAQIKNDAKTTKAGGAKLWTDVVKAEALLKYLSGDIDGFEQTLLAAKAILVGDTVRLAWELEEERGERLLGFGYERQNVAQIARAAEVLSRDALPLALKLGKQEQLQTMTALCNANMSPELETATSSDNVVNHVETMVRKILVPCRTAALLADKTPEAPMALKAGASRSYAYALSLIVAFGLGSDEDRLDVIRRTNQALTSIRPNDSKAESSGTLAFAGLIYSMLAIQGGDRSLQLKSIQFYKQSIDLLDKNNDPSAWATAHQRIGGLYQVLYGQGSQSDDLTHAIFHFEQAISVFTKAYSKLAWARTMANLATLRGQLGVSERNSALVLASIKDLKDAESVLTGSLSQSLQQGAARDRAALEVWLKRN